VTSTPHDEQLLAAGGIVVSWSGPSGEPVVTVTLNRPETRNSQTPSTWAALAHVGECMSHNTRVVVVRGSGSTFSSGLDKSAFDRAHHDSELNLARLGELPDAELDATIAEFQRGFTWWRENNDVISIAAVDGAAVGAGFQLALACDIRLATPSAKFSMREPALGLVPDLGGTHPLVQLIGFSRAMEICVTTRWVEAPEALAWGLVNAISPDANVDTVLNPFIDHVLAMPIQALRETKALLNHATDANASEQRARERAAQTRMIRILSDKGR